MSKEPTYFEKAAEANGYEIVKKADFGYAWVNPAAKSFSSVYRKTEESAWRSACDDNGIDVVPYMDSGVQDIVLQLKAALAYLKNPDDMDEHEVKNLKDDISLVLENAGLLY